MSTKDPTSALSGMEAGLYLRKSRMEEGLDTNEVLSRHQKSLLEYAQLHSIRIMEDYPEVVSGESLYARPQMLRLLQDVEEGRFQCVLCMDLDRLSRGRMKDQGIILDAFRDSGTLIVTPEKTYDLSDELDDELAEMKTFFSRREYKMINKRLRRGLQQAIEEGCYIANAPYGYQKTVLERKPTLEICQPEAEFVRMMFQLYAQGFGCLSVARHINALGAHPRRAQEFSRNSVAKILRNPVYIGKVVWNQKKHIRKGSKGNIRHMVIAQPKEEWTITDGLHPPIVDGALFDQVQAILDGRCTPAKQDGTVKNPLAGLVKCGNCGQNLQRMATKGGPYLLCTTPGCCACTQFALVEGRIVEYLEHSLSALTLPLTTQANHLDKSVPYTDLLAIQKELAATQRQKLRLHELLELGEYDLPTFHQRMQAVSTKLDALKGREASIHAAKQLKAAPPTPTTGHQMLTVLDAYRSADAARQNALLKCVIEVVFYHKEKKSQPAEFYLDIHLRPF